MDATAPAPRPLSQQRPTQAYYVPRRLLENGRGPTPSLRDAGKVESKSEENVSRVQTTHKKSSDDRSQSPKETNNNDKKENVRPKKSQQQRSPRSQPAPRPLMAEVLPKPDSLKEKRSRGRNSPPKPRYEPQQPLVAKVQQLTVSEPRVVSPKNDRGLVRPNGFNPAAEPDKEVCVCNRPQTHIVCKRCGFESIGRVVRVCGMHPLKMCLMDQRECANPVCRSIQILELPESGVSQPF